MQFEKSVFLRREVHSQSTFQRQLRRQIKKTPFILYDKGVKVYCTRSEGNKYMRDEKPWRLVQTKMTSSVIFLTHLSVFDFVNKSYFL
jgi:hypothetical protein